MPDEPRDLLVISDLHLGGRPGSPPDRGFRINTHTELLREFLLRVASHRKECGHPVELVINGDFVDFLAYEGSPEKSWRAFISDEAEALDALAHIIERERVVFDALATLLESGAELTILLGNHDVELSFPALRKSLFERLGADGNRGGIRFVYDGEAYPVGDVLIEHGNRYDGFNVLDHDRLRRSRSAMSRRMPIDPADAFAPPPGSRLVEKVMNPIKGDHGFVDLLKPETEAVVPLLIALEPTLARDIERLWNLWCLATAAASQASSVAGQPVHASQIAVASAARREPLREMLGERVDPGQLERLRALADRAAQDAPKTIGVSAVATRAWSILKLLKSDKDHATRMRILLDALRTLQDDASFDWSVETERVLKHARRLTEGGFKAVIFGHTHLAKHVRLGAGAVYVNTGTWADLMRVPSGIFAGDTDVAMATLTAFVEDLRRRAYGPYIVFMPTYAHLRLDASGHMTEARLKRFDPSAAGLE